MNAFFSSCVSWVTIGTLDGSWPPAAGATSGLPLKKAIQVGRTVDHISHMSDWLVHNGPDLVTGRTTPAFAEGVVFREDIIVLERDLAKKIVEGTLRTLKTDFLQEAVWPQPNYPSGNQALKGVASNYSTAQRNIINATHPIDHLQLAGSCLELGPEIVFQRQSSELGQCKLRVTGRLREGRHIYATLRVGSGHNRLVAVDHAADDVAFERHVAINHHQMGNVRLTQK